MSKNLILCSIDDDVIYVSMLMKKYDVGFVIVLKKNKVCGVITDRDIVIKGLSNSDLKVKHCLNKNIITVDQEKNIYDALNIMSYNKIKRLLVTSKNKIVGVISLSDIISDVNSGELKIALKCIYEFQPSNSYMEAEIDEFYL